MSLYSIEELVQKIKDFSEAEEIIYCIKNCYLRRKLPNDIIKLAVDKSIYRAFKGEDPKIRYDGWRLHGNADKLISDLNSVTSQKDYDVIANILAETLNEDWKINNPVGDKTRMQIGLAYKIINLVLKLFVFSKYIENGKLINYLHVPWDKFTLKPLQHICFDPPIPPNPSQSFVTSIEMYNSLHSFITNVAEKAGVPRIYYELMAWDGEH